MARFQANMLTYYFRLGVRSLRRNMVLTGLMIAAIAVGIGACMTALTVFRAMSGDPIPQKSRQLFAPQIDNWGPDNHPGGPPDRLEPQLSYTDVPGLMKAHAAKRQTGMYASLQSLRPADPKQKPTKVFVRAAYADFFPMFDVSLKHGGAWTASDDDSHAAVVVITQDMNDRLFIVLMSAISAALLVVTGFGIIGLTSYWVAQRRQQIGIRRALGATRRAIVRHFQTENFMIAAAGAAIGIAFAIGLNLWMVRSFEMVRMDNSGAIGGAIVILLLGQFAVLWPALRAASISPALALRSGSS
jgi:MacB-like periplasmic core domain/FtsX-like permease family